VTHDPGPVRTARARQVMADLRPQDYSKGNPTSVLDPIVEPLWAGLRALAAIDDSGAALADSGGGPIGGMAVIVDGLVAAASADLVLDGFVTKQAGQSASASTPWPDEMPSMTGFLGLRRNRAVDTVELKEASVEAVTFSEDDEIAFIATDLLWLDDTSLLDVPLLERRRLLESVVVESAVVRVGAFVRPPIGSWIVSWRAQGFAGLTYKAANSRYRPGVANPDWVVTGMPRR
jgi:hypothetical protein